MAAKKHRSSPSFSRHIAPFAPVVLALAVGAGTGRLSHPISSPSEESTEAGFAQTCENPHFPTDVATAMDDTSCPVSGNGGKETWQNEAKNNFCASGLTSSPDTPITTSLAEFVTLQNKVQQIPGINFGNTRNHPLTSKAGPAQDRSQLVALGEGSLVQLLGFVKTARQEGKESVNCGSNVTDDPSFHDIHISIVLNPADSECSGVVVEMTPHHRPAEWTPEHVKQVARAGLLVRVTGQRMFDSSHTQCQNGTAISGDPARISLWEVHPIYKFEVCPQGNCSNGGWIPLEAWNGS
jgi:hypothetical protein